MSKMIAVNIRSSKRSFRVTSRKEVGLACSFKGGLEKWTASILTSKWGILSLDNDAIMRIVAR